MDAAPCRAVVDIETAREKQKQLAACQLAPGVIYDNANKNGRQPEGRAPANRMRFNAILVAGDNPRSILVFVVETQGWGAVVLRFSRWTGGKLGPPPPWVHKYMDSTWGNLGWTRP